MLRTIVSIQNEFNQSQRRNKNMFGNLNFIWQYMKSNESEILYLINNFVNALLNSLASRHLKMSVFIKTGIQIHEIFTRSFLRYFSRGWFTELSFGGRNQRFLKVKTYRNSANDKYNLNSTKLFKRLNQKINSNGKCILYFY